MKTQEKLEKKGYKITYTFSGDVMAEKGQKAYKAKNITQLLKIIL